MTGRESRSESNRMSQEANSSPETLPNTEPQAPREIPVSRVDGDGLPPASFNPGGGDPHGYGSQADK